jgi:DNA-binding NarL/FixJ family response regulator
MNQVWGLLITRPGPLRDGLHQLLISISQIEGISQADDVSSALGQEQPCNPFLVLVVVDESDSQLDTELKQLRHKWPRAKYVVMVSDERDLVVAQASGAHEVMFEGCPASRLVEAIERTLS